MTDCTDCGNATTGVDDYDETLCRPCRDKREQSDVWFCEGCDEEQYGEPAVTDTYPGHDGPVELWFCEECC